MAKRRKGKGKTKAQLLRDKKHKNAKKMVKKMTKTIAKEKRAPIMAPISVGINRRMSNQLAIGGGRLKKQLNTTKVVRMRGREYLGVVASGVNARVPGDVIFQQVLAPQYFYSTRLGMFAGLFEKYKFHQMHFHYITSSATTDRVNMVSWVDFDPSDVGTVVYNIAPNRAIDSATSMTFSAWSDSTNSVNGNVTKVPTYFTSRGLDLRNEIQGVYQIMANANLAANTTYGSVYFEYDISLYLGEFQPTATATVAGELYSNVTTSNNMSKTKPFGDTPGWVLGSVVYPMDNSGSGNKIGPFPTGQKYLVVLTSTCSALTAASWALNGVNATSTTIYNGQDSLGLTVTFIGYVSFTTATNSITPAITNTGALTVTPSRMFISPVPDAFALDIPKLIGMKEDNLSSKLEENSSKIDLIEKELRRVLEYMKLDREVIQDDEEGGNDTEVVNSAVTSRIVQLLKGLSPGPNDIVNPGSTANVNGGTTSLSRREKAQNLHMLEMDQVSDFFTPDSLD